MNLNALLRMDEQRRRRGRWLDGLGLGPLSAPSRVLHAQPGMSLLAYGEGEGVPLLLVPAPIKRGYLWDLDPEVSVVRRALAAGFAVYRVDWQLPTPKERDLGLADYGERLLDAAVEAVAAEHGGTTPFIAGHSLGGTLAALYASVRPARPRALVLLEAPVRFGRDSGAFAPLLVNAPPAAELLGDADTAPGSLLNLASVAAAPEAFVTERVIDRFHSLFRPADWRRHQRVQRWTLDEAPMARRLFIETVEWLYRSDAFMRGNLKLNGRAARPEGVQAPVLSVVDPRSRVVPRGSVLPFHRAIGSPVQRVLEYHGDVGIALQHVGVLVGPSAHRRLWPDVLAWLHELAGTPGRPAGAAAAGRLS